MAVPPHRPTSQFYTCAIRLFRATGADGYRMYRYNTDEGQQPAMTTTPIEQPDDSGVPCWFHEFALANAAQHAELADRIAQAEQRSIDRIGQAEQHNMDRTAQAEQRGIDRTAQAEQRGIDRTAQAEQQGMTVRRKPNSGASTASRGSRRGSWPSSNGLPGWRPASSAGWWEVRLEWSGCSRQWLPLPPLPGPSGARSKADLSPYQLCLRYALKSDD